MEERLQQPVFESAFWAKKDDKDEFKWLPLKQHSLDTLRIAGLLWEHWLSPCQKKVIIEGLKWENNASFDTLSFYTLEEKAKAILTFLAAVHDLGKATPVFQTKKSFHNSQDLDKQLLEKIEHKGFSGIMNLSFLNSNDVHHALASHTLLHHYGLPHSLASIVGAHHGKAVDKVCDVDDQLSSYTAHYFQNSDNKKDTEKLWQRSQKEMFDWAVEESGLKGLISFPSATKAAAVLLSGIIIMADWIASNEYFFPLIPIAKSMGDIKQPERTERGWELWFKNYRWEPAEIQNIREDYQYLFSFTPNVVQEELAKLILESENPGIFILEAPMGKGKTEAALFSAIQLAYKSGLSGVFFGLPTQATSNGIFPRVSSWLNRICKMDKESKSLRLVHAKAHMNSEFMSISRHIDLDGDASVITNQWFAGKKTSMLDDFVVGTVDQFLLMALKKKHLSLRHLGFSKKVVIIDEVHAYDAYMSQYLERAIYWMGVYGCPVLILSATLPFQKREQLIKAYLNGKSLKTRELKQATCWNTSEAYPLITYTDGDEIKQLEVVDDEEGKRVELIKMYRREDEGEEVDFSKISCYLKEELIDGGVVGIVVNTVKRAQKLARYLMEDEFFGREGVELHHSAFLMSDRVKKEECLLRSIGKNGIRPEKKVIIGTQVIEQSLDIDFDVMFSDLAPMDLLLQRMGRLHRHKLVKRSPKLRGPKFYIMGLNENFEFEEGSRAVYKDYYLARTQYYLPDNVVLPADISRLVQRVYAETELDLEEELKEKYKKAKEDYDILIENKKESAKTFLLGKRNESKDKGVIGWLGGFDPNKDDEAGFAQVRDGGENIEVLVVKECGEGYSFLDENVDISSKLDDYTLIQKLLNQSLKLPAIFSFVPKITKNTIETLERDNLNLLPEWQKNPWLKGSLGIVLGKDNCYTLENKSLKYSNEFGLEYERREDE